MVSSLAATMSLWQQPVIVATVLLSSLLLTAFISGQDNSDSYDAPETIADWNNEGMNSFGERGTQWNAVKYNVFDQSQSLNAPGSENFFNSYRINFQCARETSNEDCNGASLLICYPSVLENALGEKDDNPPVFRTMASTLITNDRENEITQNCSNLMGQCKRDDMCRQKMPQSVQKDDFDEVWHGFLIKRFGGRFVVELPFGKNAKSIEIEVPENNDPNMNLEFGKNEMFKRTFFVKPNPLHDPGLITGQTNGTKRSGKCFNRMLKADGWMPLKEAKHLWSLSIDLLPTEEDLDQIRFYTQTFPYKLNQDVCVKDDPAALKLDKEELNDYIVATPATPEFTQNVGPKRRGNGNKGGKGDAMQFYPIANGRKSIELNSYLPEIEMFVHGRVPGKATNFKISVFQGENSNKDGTEIMEITASFEDPQIEPTSCNVHFFPQTEQKSCMSTIPGSGFKRREGFWLLLKIKSGTVDVNVNCMKLHFQWQRPKYTSKQYILFEGDIELPTSDMDAVNLLSDVKNDTVPIGKPSSKSLDIHGNGLIDVDTLLIINGKLLEKVEDVTFELLSETKEKIFAMEITPGEEKCENDCIISEGNQCLQFEMIKDDEEKNPSTSTAEQEEHQEQQQTQNDQTEKEQICYRNNLNLIVYQTTNQERTLYWNGINRKTIDEKTDVAAKVVKMSGDINMLSDTDLHIYTKYNGRQQFDALFYEKDSIIFNLIWLDKNDGQQQMKEECTFVIKFMCHENICNKNGVDPTKIYDSFILTIDQKNEKAEVKVFKSNVHELTEAATNDTKFENTLGEPVWIKILAEKSLQKIAVYVNGNEYMDVEYTNIRKDDFFDLAQKLSFEGQNYHLLNIPTIMPFFTQINPLGQTLEERTTVTFTFRLLPNAYLMEFMLFKRGRAKQRDFFTQSINGTADAKVIMHMRVVNITKGGKTEICINYNKFLPSDLEDCNEKGRKSKDIAPILIARKGNRMTVSFMLKQKSIELIVDKNSPLKFSYALDFQPLEANDLMINGDVALDSEPEKRECCVKHPDDEHCHLLLPKDGCKKTDEPTSTTESEHPETPEK